MRRGSAARWKCERAVGESQPASRWRRRQAGSVVGRRQRVARTQAALRASATPGLLSLTARVANSLSPARPRSFPSYLVPA